MSDLLREFAGDAPVHYWSFKKDSTLVGKFVDVKMESNKFSASPKPTYYIASGGFTHKFTSESKGLARQLMDMVGKNVSIQRVGYGMETKFYVKEVME